MPDKAAMKEQTSKIFMDLFNLFVKDMQQLLDERGLSEIYQEEIKNYLCKVVGKRFGYYPQHQGFISVDAKKFRRHSPHKFLLMTSRMVTYYMENLSGKEFAGERSEGSKSPLTNEELLARCKEIVEAFYKYRYAGKVRLCTSIFNEELVEIVKNKDNLSDLTMVLTYLPLLYVENPEMAERLSSSDLLSLNDDIPIAKRVADLEETLKLQSKKTGSKKRGVEDGKDSAKRSCAAGKRSQDKQQALPAPTPIPRQLAGGSYSTDDLSLASFRTGNNLYPVPPPKASLSAESVPKTVLSTCHGIAPVTFSLGRG